MSLSSIAEMAASKSLLTRIAACAAQQGEFGPMVWASGNIWEIVSSPGWGDKWQFAADNWQVNANPDVGARTDVISDADILAAVQALKTKQAGSTNG